MKLDFEIFETGCGDFRMNKSSIWRHGNQFDKETMLQRIWRSWGMDSPEVICGGTWICTNTLKNICSYPPWIAINALEAMLYYFEKNNCDPPVEVLQALDALRDSIRPVCDGSIKFSAKYKECYDSMSVVWKDMTIDGKLTFKSFKPRVKSESFIKTDVEEVIKDILCYGQDQARKALRFLREHMSDTHPEEYTKSIHAFMHASALINIELWKKPEVTYPQTMSQIAPLLSGWAENH